MPNQRIGFRGQLLGLTCGLLATGWLTAAQAQSAFYVDPTSTPALWVEQHADDPRAPIVDKLAQVPMAHWFGGWQPNIRQAVNQFVSAAAQAKQVPILVAYNIPARDCGGASKGGAEAANAYRQWIEAYTQGLGKHKAVVVLEPDALAQLYCQKREQQGRERLELLRYAVNHFRLNAPATDLYLDAGNGYWIAADQMAARLNSAGLRQAKGFSLNVSNFYPTSESMHYAQRLNRALVEKYGYSKPYLIDTSRNGKGSIRQWCNPEGRQVGKSSTDVNASPLLLWIKVPGNSDGPCGSAPDTEAGVFSPELAVGLVEGR